MDIAFDDVSHVYNPGTPYERLALAHVSLRIPSGSFTSIIGHTGSGKSTLVQHMDGLLRPSSGVIRAGDFVIRPKKSKKKLNFKPLRRKIGFVFQYPEHQLFDETVIKDVCFGPINFGVPPEEAARLAEKSLELVGLPAEFWQRSPFDLSGGQMRRVAIAGVLASQPEAVILDEPTAGLDPSGRSDILGLFSHLNKERKMTIIMVTHNMSDAACFSDQVIAMNDGKVALSGMPRQVFSQAEKLRAIGLDLPETMLFLNKLTAGLRTDRPRTVFTLPETADEVVRLLKDGSGRHV
ncbi:MAG: energy-coupling factor transporter ATPase [Sporolactobacillus sp.]|jgi:energy-coupling factor transport system ATP-binding protein|nr:energy-coupling factor transporter ATPase [Sporolactobacillus sp.]